MKELSDGTKVSSRTYYYLLDFKDRYLDEFIQLSFNKDRLCDLSIGEYQKFFEHATEFDNKELNRTKRIKFEEHGKDITKS